ncbi:MAG: hypothetical protein QOK31_475 [Solirubrobacteraceae bacterium]|nr:hypothetical protein [Solirubrobacteraceae bacterium]
MVGYLTRAVAFFVLGGLVGLMSDRNAKAEREREELLARVQELARADQVTGLPNRRAWDEEIRRQPNDRDAGVSLAMIDIDGFKSINDRLGHQAGDDLLAEAATAWRAAIRDADFLARIGGDEFAMLLAQSSPDETRDRLERLRAATPAGHTCSAGITTWQPGEPAEAAIRRADGALYEAKRNGRDRTHDASYDG